MAKSKYLQGLFDDDAASECPPLTPPMVRQAEKSLGYRLPAAYIELLAICNGGYLKRSEFPTTKCPRWAADHVSFDHVMGVGGDEGIDGETGSAYLIGEWSYPPVGVVISTEGHTAFMLDYRECGAEGEPRVIWIDTEADGPEPDVVVLAPDLGTFLTQLREPRDDDNGVLELSGAVGQSLPVAYFDFLDGLSARPRIFESDSRPTLAFGRRHWRPYTREGLQESIRYNRGTPRPRAHETAAIAEMLGKGDEPLRAEMTYALRENGFDLERLSRGFCIGDDGNGEPLFVDAQSGAVFAYHHDGMDVAHWADSLEVLIAESQDWTGDETNDAGNGSY